jgi:hypothetical protein
VTDGIKPLGLTFCAEMETNRWVSANFAHGTPQNKEFFRIEEHARLINKALGKHGPVQDGSRANPQLFQLRKIASGKAEVFIHRFTQI